MAETGHNNPPGMIETSQETAKDISAWMAENPVIQSEDSAREAKVYLDRGKLCLKDMEDERDGKVRPLNEQVKEINETYKAPKGILSGVIHTLSERIGAYIRAEESKRIAAAVEAQRIADAAEQAAREAEAAEREAIGSASSGELGVDIAAHVVQADNAFREYEKASRQAAIAEKETHVKIGGGFSRAISLRKKETIVVADPHAALLELGPTEDIIEAIIKSARAFKKLRGRLPNGVGVYETESL